MPPLYRDPQFTFRFSDDRIVPRFHLDGVEAGQRVSVFALDPAGGGPSKLLLTATVGDGGCVELPQPLVVRAGGGFVAVPQADPGDGTG